MWLFSQTQDPSLPYQLAYVSCSRSPLDEATLSDILESSQRNNARDQITGVLMYHDQLFFQILEGEQTAVEDCYHKRIFRDHRHSGLSISWCNAVDSRTFSDWLMGYAGPDEIGQYTKGTFHSLEQLESDNSLNQPSRHVALELALSIFKNSRSYIPAS
ncbi:BLUF domain-containing protein [Roseovarius sp. S1116L3]|uniref:BLUF domain-containing protein n=1 Tax=Roseovarius roseus TaxID=3342636 RepID=UPI0037267175